jgi:hypothetical protein
MRDQLREIGTFENGRLKGAGSKGKSEKVG